MELKLDEKEQLHGTPQIVVQEQSEDDESEQDEIMEAKRRQSMLVEENDALISSTAGLQQQMEHLNSAHLAETLELNESIKEKDKIIEHLKSDLKT